MIWEEIAPTPVLAKSAPSRAPFLLAAIVGSLALHAALVLGMFQWRLPATTPRVEKNRTATMSFLIAPDDDGEAPTPNPPHAMMIAGGPGEEGAQLISPSIGSVGGSAGATVTPVSLQPGTANAGLGTRSSPCFCGMSVQAKRIVYLIDASASMSHHGAWNRACRELWLSLQSLSEDVQFQIVVYNNHPRSLLPARIGWQQMSPDLMREIVQALQNQPIEGGTQHGPALMHALALRPDVLFFLTDADDLNLDDLAAAQRINRGQTRVHTVELHTGNRDRDDMPLQRLARSSGGAYRALVADR